MSGFVLSSGEARTPTLRLAAEVKGNWVPLVTSWILLAQRQGPRPVHLSVCKDKILDEAFRLGLERRWYPRVCNDGGRGCYWTDFDEGRPVKFT